MVDNHINIWHDTPSLIEQNPDLVIEIPENMFGDVNRAVRSSYGSDLYELAKTSPKDAYEAIPKGIAHVYVSQSPWTRDVVTGMKVEGCHDSPDAQRAFTEKLLQDSMTPPIELEPKDIVVRIIRERTLWDIIKRRLPRADVALSFTVFP